jgi:hypothetical protein
MHISARFAPLLFSALLSAIMVCIVSAFVLTMAQGIHAGLAGQWLKRCVTTWPVAFPKTKSLTAPYPSTVPTIIVTPPVAKFPRSATVALPSGDPRVCSIWP